MYLNYVSWSVYSPVLLLFYCCISFNYWMIHDSFYWMFFYLDLFVMVFETKLCKMVLLQIFSVFSFVYTHTHSVFLALFIPTPIQCFGASICLSTYLSIDKNWQPLIWHLCCMDTFILFNYKLVLSLVLLSISYFYFHDESLLCSLSYFLFRSLFIVWTVCYRVLISLLIWH